MPPHARMSLAQQLLLRALVAWMWREPYDRPLARYGTRLHDEFMLPYFVANDFADVLERSAARRLPPSIRRGSRAHHEFRFPLIGKVGLSRHRDGTSHCARAVARARRGCRRGRHGALCRQLGRAAAGARSTAPPASATALPSTAAMCRCARPGGRANMSPASAIARGSRRARCIRRCRWTRRWCSISTTPGTSARSAAAPITSPIPAGAISSASRSMPTRPRAGGARVSSPFGHTPGHLPAGEFAPAGEHPVTLDLRRV